MTWNVWPHSRLEAAKCVIPFCTLYTPARQTSQLQVGVGGGWAGAGGLAWRVAPCWRWPPAAALLCSPGNRLHRLLAAQHARQCAANVFFDRPPPPPPPPPVTQQSAHPASPNRLLPGYLPCSSLNTPAPAPARLPCPCPCRWLSTTRCPARPAALCSTPTPPSTSTPSSGPAPSATPATTSRRTTRGSARPPSPPSSSPSTAPSSTRCPARAPSPPPPTSLSSTPACPRTSCWRPRRRCSRR